MGKTVRHQKTYFRDDENQRNDEWKKKKRKAKAQREKRNKRNLECLPPQ